MAHQVNASPPPQVETSSAESSSSGSPLPDGSPAVDLPAFLRSHDGPPLTARDLKMLQLPRKFRSVLDSSLLGGIDGVPLGKERVTHLGKFISSDDR